MLIGDRHRGVPAEGRLPGEQLEEDHPRGVQVGAGVDLLAARRLSLEMVYLMQLDSEGKPVVVLKEVKP